MLNKIKGTKIIFGIETVSMKRFRSCLSPLIYIRIHLKLKPRSLLSLTICIPFLSVRLSLNVHPSRDLEVSNQNLSCI